MPRRGKDGDGVFQKPSGSGIYWARWKDEKGDLHHQKIGPGEKSRQEAQRVVYRQRELARDRQLYPEKYAVPPPPPEQWTLKQAIEDYQLHSPANRDSGSWLTDDLIGKAWIRLWGGRLVDDIRPMEVRDWMVRRTRDVSQRSATNATIKPSTVNREVGVLRRVCRRAVECGKATSDPTAKVRKMKEGSPPPRYLHTDEDERLRAVLTGRDWLAVELAYCTGMRRGEMFPLRKCQVDLHSRRIILPRPKSQEPEVVILSTRAVQIIVQLMDTDSEYVFPHHSGHGHVNSANYVRDHFLPALERAKIVNFRWHDLRHTYASWMAIQGVDLFRIQKLMRHRSIQMTQIYAHLSPDHLERAVEFSGVPRNVTNQEANRQEDNEPSADAIPHDA